MKNYMSLKQAAEETGMAEYMLRMYCKQDKIRYLRSGVKYVIRLDWLEEDLAKLSTVNLEKFASKNNSGYGTLRKITE